MKKTFALLAAVTLFGATSAMAQEKEEAPRKVIVKEVNGETTVSISSMQGGFPVEEIYTGEAAKKKLEELEAENAKTLSEENVEVEVTEENGVKTVTLTSMENGEKKVEVFEGAAAEAKLKELEEGAPKEEFKMQSEKKVIREKSVD